MKRQQKEEGRQKETTESNDTAHMKEGGREKVEEGGGKNVRKEKPSRERATRSLRLSGPVSGSKKKKKQLSITVICLTVFDTHGKTDVVVTNLCGYVNGKISYDRLRRSRHTQVINPLLQEIL